MGNQWKLILKTKHTPKNLLVCPRTLNSKFYSGYFLPSYPSLSVQKWLPLDLVSLVPAVINSRRNRDLKIFKLIYRKGKKINRFLKISKPTNKSNLNAKSGWKSIRYATLKKPKNGANYIFSCYSTVMVCPSNDNWTCWKHSLYTPQCIHSLRASLSHSYSSYLNKDDNIHKSEALKR